MKVIFLDIDGVMRSIYSQTLFTFDCNCVDALNLLFNPTDGFPDLKIVVSSSWRKECSDFESNMIYLKRKFKEQGVIGEVIGLTPTIEFKQRGCEILQWLGDQSNVDDYMVVDDDINLGFFVIPQNHMFFTYYKTGLTDDNAIVLAKRFKEGIKQK